MLNIHPIRALTSLFNVWRNPHNTHEGGKLIGALSGRSWYRFYDRWRNDITLDGLAEHLGSVDRMSRYPRGTLGHVYFEWCQRKGFGPFQLTPELEYVFPEPRTVGEELVFNREKAAHDLWHIVTGYGSDPLGEACLVYFMWPQHQNHGLHLPRLLCAVNHWRHREALMEAHLRGKAAGFLPAYPWVRALGKSLAQVKWELGLDTHPTFYDSTEIDECA